MMSDVEAYRNQQEVLDDLKAQQPAPPSAGATAGTFSGVIVGKKKDSSKGKQCKVLVGSNSILIQYKKVRSLRLLPPCVRTLISVCCVFVTIGRFLQSQRCHG